MEWASFIKKNHQKKEGDVTFFSITHGFLGAELIAGEGEDLEPPRVVRIVQFGELDIVGIR